MNGIMEKCKLALDLHVEFRLGDAWLGLCILKNGATWRTGTAWVCIIPCLPITVNWSTL